jgi:hypothetical protein
MSGAARRCGWQKTHQMNAQGRQARSLSHLPHLEVIRPLQTRKLHICAAKEEGKMKFESKEARILCPLRLLCLKHPFFSLCCIRQSGLRRLHRGKLPFLSW